MSSPIWTPAALRSEARPAKGSGWRLVEAQHRVSTMKLVDTLEEQALLEEEIERTKPPVPPECAGLHYLLATPFRYGRYPGNSRLRREGYSPGVFYASEVAETAVAETVFYRLLFFAESLGTPWPRNPLEFTAFEVAYATKKAIDLTAPPFSADAQRWTHPSDYAACLDLADAAHEAELGLIRYRSVRDPQGRANLAVLRCTVFTAAQPTAYDTWRIALSDKGATALCDRSDMRLGFSLADFAADSRIANIISRL
ncbi:MAG: RES family NAD+ phosphorylase [Rhizobiaceae bacterium]